MRRDTTWTKSLFSRMIIAFLLVTLPLYGLVIGVFNWTIQMQRTDISNNMLSQVNFYRDSLEKEIKRIKQLQYTCLSDANLNQLALVPQSLNDYNKVKAISLINERLSVIASSSMYITSVNAYIPSINRVISSTQYQLSIPEEEYAALSNSDYNINAQIIFWDNRLFLNAVYRIYPTDILGGKPPKPAYILGIELSKKQLQNALVQFHEYKNDGILMIDKQNRYELISGGDSDVISGVENLVKDNTKKNPSGIQSIQIGGNRFLIAYTESEYLGIILTKFIPEEEAFRSFNIYYIWFWLFILLAVLIIFIYSFFTYRHIHKPMVKLLNSFDLMGKGNLSVSITHRYDDEFRSLYQRFNDMVSELNILIDQEYRQRILVQNAQLKQLQTQINPHFLYNSYYILYRMMVMDDRENSISFVEQLGTYLKFITRNAEDEIPLSSEIEHARIYAEIQAMRFSSRISLEFEQLPDEYASIKVPRLIVQPMLENAFEHGLEHKEKDGLLRISFRESEGCLKITVEDNGNGMSDADLEQLRLIVTENEFSNGSEITGLKNIHKRLQLKYGYESGLEFTRSELGGLKAVIRLALKEENDV